jgi:hypothetical protein
MELEHDTEAINLLIDEREYDIYVGRGNAKLGLKASQFACPYSVGRYGNREHKVGEYKVWLASKPHLVRIARRTLKGKIIAASSNLGLAYAQVLQEIAES